VVTTLLKMPFPYLAPHESPGKFDSHQDRPENLVSLRILLNFPFSYLDREEDRVLLRIGGRARPSYGKNHALTSNSDLRPFLQAKVQESVPGQTKFLKKNWNF
jgi:hypothetical protein